MSSKRPAAMRKICVAVLLLLLFGAFAYASADVIISEVMASNGFYENGAAYDWAELYNDGDRTVDLSGWYFSDSKKDPLKWSFPKGTALKSGKCLVIYCTGETGHAKGSGQTFYTDFAISSSGETLILSDRDGNEVQRLKLPAQYGCVSYGKALRGNAYGYFETATKGAPNGDGVCARRTESPRFDMAGGFYADSVSVRAFVNGEDAEIRYTTDGSTPTRKSSLYPEKGLEIRKTTALRIKAFRKDEVSSETVSASYFINDDPLTPIVSLITDDCYLFDKKTGILTKGSGKTPNYARGWEYPVNIEYFTEDGVCGINQTGTFTCSGHSARVNAQKSIALYARKAWGEERFRFNPFPTRQYDSYKSLLLRAANSDTYATRLRDVVASSLAEGQGILYQDYQVIQVYINGEYYGHYNLREKINKHFIAQYENVTDEKDVDAIDVLARTGTDEFLRNGDNADWLELCDFCRKKDLNVPENLRYVEERLDIDNMFTHAAFEIILGNVDFTNVRVYRVPGGKWKYLLFDVEACWRGLDSTPIEYYIKPVKGKIQGFRHEPLNALLRVPEYKARFLNRVAELLQTVFRWENVKEHFDAVISRLEPILPRHIARWKNMKITNWRKNIKATKYYARVRPRKIPSLLKTAMKLTDAEVREYFGDALKVLEEHNVIR